MLAAAELAFGVAGYAAVGSICWPLARAKRLLVGNLASVTFVLSIGFLVATLAPSKIFSKAAQVLHVRDKETFSVLRLRAAALMVHSSLRLLEGIAFAALVSAWQHVTIWDAFALAGTYAYAWLAGFMALFAPAGLGVRELVLYTALSPHMSSAQALFVPAAFRLLSALRDGLMLLVGLLLPEQS